MVVEKLVIKEMLLLSTII